jgi:hypothetical protein
MRAPNSHNTDHRKTRTSSFAVINKLKVRLPENILRPRSHFAFPFKARTENKVLSLHLRSSHQSPIESLLFKFAFFEAIRNLESGWIFVARFRGAERRLPLREWRFVVGCRH